MHFSKVHLHTTARPYSKPTEESVNIVAILYLIDVLTDYDTEGKTNNRALIKVGKLTANIPGTARQTHQQLKQGILR